MGGHTTSCRRMYPTAPARRTRRLIRSPAPASDELSTTTVADFDTPAPRVPGFQPTGRKDSHCKVIRRP
jgi:hypothetical protein